MKSAHKSWLLVALLGLGLATQAAVAAPVFTPPEPALPTNGFFVRNGDVWVLVGDSITWQNLYTVYLEAFIRARYPGLAFTTVNSGKSGEVYIQGIIRFRDTIAAYKPTLVTVNYGMNDHAKVFPGEQDFLENPHSAPQRFVEAVQGTGARLLMFSASPLLAPADYASDGGKFRLTGQKVDGTTRPEGWRSNPVNRQFADKLSQLAARNQVPFIDQMAPLQQIFAATYGRDRVAALRQGLVKLLDTPLTMTNYKTQGVALSVAVKPFLDNPALVALLPAPDLDHLLLQWQGLKGAKVEQWEAFRQFLRGWAAQVDAATPPFIQLSGYTGSERPTDLIHPNEAGHLCMAGVLLKLLDADGLVSDVRIDAEKQVVMSATKAEVRDLKIQKGIVSFKRWDQSLPFPIDPLARPALGVDVPTSLGSPHSIFGLSRYLLAVEHLPAGRYEIAIDGEAVAVTTAEQLTLGFDAGLLDKGPVAAQTLRVLAAVRANTIRAVVGKGEPPPSTRVEPKVLAEARPVEHVWTVKWLE